MSSDADGILPADMLKCVNMNETVYGGDITVSLKECFVNRPTVKYENEINNYGMLCQCQMSGVQSTSAVSEVIIYINALSDSTLDTA